MSKLTPAQVTALDAFEAQFREGIRGPLRELLERVMTDLHEDVAQATHRALRRVYGTEAVDR